MVNSISILGCTGSIGRQTIAVAEHIGMRVAALTANRKIELLEEQARRLKPEFVAVYDEDAAKQFRIAVADTDIRVGSGMSGLIEARDSRLIRLRCDGGVGRGRAEADACRHRREKAHSACKQGDACLRGQHSHAPRGGDGRGDSACRLRALRHLPVPHGAWKGELKKILLTGSGGPFRGRPREELEDVTPEQAVKHPNWSMGAKISVDSATMMNKGLEFIEAMHLFGVTPDDIQVVIHPQSVIHSMVELVDGTVIAQLGVPDMGLPIQLALTYPERRESMFDRLDFWKLIDLSFEAPDYEKTPCLRLAMDAARAGGTVPCVMSAANEVAVGLFLQHKLGYNRIYDCAAAAVDALGSAQEADLETILAADAAARAFVREHCSK